MKIFITTHGQYEENHISLCTTNFEFAIKHFVDYSKTNWWKSMSSLECWENNKQIFDYGHMNYDIINSTYGDARKNITYEDIRNDILKQFKF